MKVCTSIIGPALKRKKKPYSRLKTFHKFLLFYKGTGKQSDLGRIADKKEILDGATLFQKNVD